MAREIEPRGLLLSLRHAPCAHICRYCLVSETRRGTNLSFARFEDLAHRFHDWQQSTRPDLTVRTFVGPSFDYDLDTLAGVGRLRARRGTPLTTLNLGGLRIRTGDALETWITERQAAGITGFHVSLAGCDDVHDRWNGRAGDFAYQTGILRRAAERGMARHERLFLTQNTLPVFDRLLDQLDAIPGPAPSRYISLFFYASLAMRYEDERITERIRDSLPARITGIRFWRAQDWRSERDWIPLLLQQAAQPRKMTLKLDVDETNIDRLETMSCDEIFDERSELYQTDYQRVPSLEELCSRYGDPNGDRIYMLSRDLEQKWMAHHHHETATPFPLD
jgi:hypothetical protein